MLPIHAIWFREERSLVVSNAGHGDFNLIIERETVERLGPRASDEQRQFWRLPKDRATRIAVNSAAAHELFDSGKQSTLSLVLDGEFTEGTPLVFVVDSNEHTADGAANFRCLDGYEGASEAELKDYLRSVLEPAVVARIRGVWVSPIASDGTAIRIGPARAITLPPDRMTIEVRRPVDTSDTKSRVELVATLGGERNGPAQYVPVKSWMAVLLIWRGVYAGRTRAPAPSAVQEGFQESVARFLGRQIPFSRDPATATTRRRPIARGHFLAQPAPVTGKPSAAPFWQFEGAVDVGDVLMLCIPSRSSHPVEVRHDPDHDLYKLSTEHFDLGILCWRADPEQLTAVAWSDLGSGARAELHDQLLDELALHPERDAVARSGPSDRSPAELVFAAVPRALTLEYDAALETDEELTGIAEDWFATLSAEAVEKLSASGRRPPQLANVVRFLPVALHDVPNTLASWSGIERDAASLQERVVRIARLLQPAIAPKPHLRSDTAVWRSIDRAVDVTAMGGDYELVEALRNLAPGVNGALGILDPTALSAADTLMEKLETALRNAQRDNAPMPPAP